MGTSYLTDAQKNSLSNHFYDLHATFARPITIFKTAQETVAVSNPDNNYLFANAPFNSTVATVIQSGVFPARIQYGKKEQLNQFNAGPNMQNQIWLQEGEVRIKLDPTGAAFFAGCERVTFDGTVFKMSTSDRPHGLFIPSGSPPKFYTYYLTKLN